MHWRVDPEVEQLTQNFYTFGELGNVFRKLAVVRTLGEPVDQLQETAFGVIADCIIAEQQGGPELRAKVLGATVGRLERNKLYWTRHQEGAHWEDRIVGELAEEIEKTRGGNFQEQYEDARTNVLYGTWRKEAMLDHYVWLMNRESPDEIDPQLHEWYEKYIVAGAKETSSS